MMAHEIIVEEKDVGQRIDVFLSKTLPEVPSRTFVKRLIDNGLVTVDGEKIKPHHKVAAKEIVCVEAYSVPTPEDIKPENIPLDIVYEDDDLVIINKPSGMTAHPVNERDRGTLVNALLFHFQQLSDVNTAMRPGIVHRLDKETSGVIIVAKNNVCHTKLAKQFEKHKVVKRYVALVQGDVEFDEGVVDVPLGKHPKHHDMKAVCYDEKAKDARTHYKVINHAKGRTLIALYPQTGRTHQLRVHMAHLGHPILGDDKYGRKDTFPRLALHAQSIGFAHPKTKKFVEFSVPEPKEFRD